MSIDQEIVRGQYSGHGIFMSPSSPSPTLTMFSSEFVTPAKSVNSTFYMIWQSSKEGEKGCQQHGFKGRTSSASLYGGARSRQQTISHRRPLPSSPRNDRTRHRVSEATYHDRRPGKIRREGPH